MPLPDQHILELYRTPGRQEQALSLLLEHYQKPLYAYLRRMLQDHDDTDEVLQLVFIKVWRNLEGFRGEASLKTWLYRIASNECYSFLKKKRRHAAAALEELTQAAQPLAEQHELPEIEQLQQLLGEAIDTLPERQRDVFCLRYFDEMPYEQMAEHLQLTEGALKASYHHAAKKIRTYLTGRLNAQA